MQGSACLASLVLAISKGIASRNQMSASHWYGLPQLADADGHPALYVGKPRLVYRVHLINCKKSLGVDWKRCCELSTGIEVSWYGTAQRIAP
jgi:hypothetical protein